jgi:hypothetical protein
MADIRVAVRPVGVERALPGEAAVEVTLTNSGTDPAPIDLSLAHIPSLALEVRDAAGRPVLLPAPQVPRSRDDRAQVTLAPGQSHQFRLPIPFDAHRPAGAYQVRYRHRTPATSQVSRTVAPAEVAMSDWTTVTLADRADLRGLSAPLQTIRPEVTIGWFDRLWRCLLCLIWIFRKRRCDKVASVEVDRAITETITNDPRGDGTYGWNARFLLSLDQPNCRVTVTVRIRVTGAITAAQKTAWKNAIEAKWSNTFKLCCREGCCRGCCANGYAIVCDVQFVATGEHQVVAAGADTLDMGNWGAADTVDITHEFGHMLGNKDEYFTVDGINYGPGRQPGGNVMNNPANQPVAKHFDLIRQEAELLIGGVNCTVKGAAEAC